LEGRIIFINAIFDLCEQVEKCITTAIQRFHIIIFNPYSSTEQSRCRRGEELVGPKIEKASIGGSKKVAMYLLHREAHI
jgi:hypothetical protein